MLRAALAFCLLSEFGALTQNDLPPHVLQLARIKEGVEEQLHEAQDYTCLQTIERFRRTSANEKFRLADVVRLEVTRVDGDEVYSWPGADSFSAVHPSELAGGGMATTGEFSAHARSIFMNRAATLTVQDNDAGEQFALTYALPSFASGFTVRRNAREATVGAKGIVHVDRATFRLQRIGLEAEAVPPGLGISSLAAVISYIPVQLGEVKAVLPSTAETTMTLFSGEQRRNRITFSHWREYSSLSQIRFSDLEQDSQSSNQADVPEIGPGLTIETRIRTTIDSRHSATGDVIEAVVERDVMRGKQLVLPAGTVMTGRIRRLERNRSTIPYVALALELSSIDLHGLRVPVHLDLRGIELRNGMSLRIPGSRYRVSTTHLLHGGKLDVAASEEFVDNSLLSVVSFFVEGEELLLAPGLRVTWRTRSPVEAPKRRRPETGRRDDMIRSPRPW